MFLGRNRGLSELGYKNLTDKNFLGANTKRGLVLLHEYLGCLTKKV